jgi:hypothetical protein
MIYLIESRIERRAESEEMAKIATSIEIGFISIGFISVGLLTGTIPACKYT